jgi:hypothetical protein
MLVPSAFAGVPTVEDAVDAWNQARGAVADAVDFAHVDITTDIKDAQIGGVVLVQGTAWAHPGFEIGAIRFYVDHVYVGDGGRAETWSFEMDTRRLLDGVHEFDVDVIAAPVRGDVWVAGYASSDSVRFQTLNHVTGVILHEATYEGLDTWSDLWTTTLDRDYVGLRMTVTTEPDPAGAPLAGGPLVGQAVAAYHEKGSPEAGPTKTWIATFGLLHGGGVTVISRPPHDMLKAGSTLGLAAGFVGDGKVTIRIEAIPWP